MKTCVLAAMSVVLLASLSFAQEGKKAPPGKGEQPRATTKAGTPGLKGRVNTDVRSDGLKKFDRPITMPPDRRPPPRTGGSWHWHRHHGWIWFDVGSAPRTVLIPEGFRLPPRVVSYEASSAPLIVTCPHCGKEICVYVE